MNQELLAGIVMCLIGACLSFVSPVKIWTITDKWKTVGGERPSNSFIVITKVLGFAFVVAGACLLLSSVI